MALFVIYGVQNSGKTHTCWLIYNLLRAEATREIGFTPQTLSSKPTYSEVLQHIEDSFCGKPVPALSDFRALFEYKDRKIAIFSAGDVLGDDDENRQNWNNQDWIDFVNNMHWAELNDVDHVICCSRSLNKTGSVQRYIMEHYRMHVYRWYYKNRIYTTAQEQIADAQRTAIEVFRDIKIDY